MFNIYLYINRIDLVNGDIKNQRVLYLIKILRKIVLLKIHLL